MLSKKVTKLLNEQVNKEFYSAYLYLDFANYLGKMGLTGYANWYRVQAQEERDHAMLFYSYLHHNNQNVNLEAIEKPEVKADTVLEIMEASLAHEQYVTESINDIYEVALREKDYRTKEFLDWFVKEQGEEEANSQNLIDKVKLLGADPKNMYLLDQELTSRVYSAPSLVIG